MHEDEIVARRRENNRVEYRVQPSLMVAVLVGGWRGGSGGSGDGGGPSRHIVW